MASYGPTALRFHLKIPKLCILLFSQTLEVTEGSGDSWRVHVDAKELTWGVRGLFVRNAYDSTGKQNRELCFLYNAGVIFPPKINLFQIFDRLGNTVSFKWNLLARKWYNREGECFANPVIMLCCANGRAGRYILLLNVSHLDIYVFAQKWSEKSYLYNY